MGIEFDISIILIYFNFNLTKNKQKFEEKDVHYYIN